MGCPTCPRENAEAMMILVKCLRAAGCARESAAVCSATARLLAPELGPSCQCPPPALRAWLLCGKARSCATCSPAADRGLADAFVAAGGGEAVREAMNVHANCLEVVREGSRVLAAACERAGGEAATKLAAVGAHHLCATASMRFPCNTAVAECCARCVFWVVMKTPAAAWEHASPRCARALSDGLADAFHGGSYAFHALGALTALLRQREQSAHIRGTALQGCVNALRSPIGERSDVRGAAFIFLYVIGREGNAAEARRHGAVREAARWLAAARPEDLSESDGWVWHAQQFLEDARNAADKEEQ